jgi:hypothetical protein
MAGSLSAWRYVISPRLAERKARFAVGYLIICGTVLTLFVVALLR